MPSNGSSQMQMPKHLVSSAIRNVHDNVTAALTQKQRIDRLDMDMQYCVRVLTFNLV